MTGHINPKILGSTVVGLALVAGAYTVSNFGKSDLQTQEANIPATEQNQRTTITVTDNDNNGIEDWRDDFVTTEPIILNKATSTYTLPETLTGKTGISVLEDLIAARIYGPFGSSNEEVITKTINNLEVETAQTLYNTKQIDIFEDWGEQDIVNYANTIANIILKYDLADSEGELTILSEILKNPNGDNESKIKELETIATAYKHYLDDTLKVPVPSLLAKEHLDLINTYSAIYSDVDAMSKATNDPAVTLLRLKRYRDDATALGYALQNMYFALNNSGVLFEATDPAIFFTVFSPDYKI